MNDFVIEAMNLHKEYEDFVAVDDLDLQIKRGEVFGFLGPNGAGKTTSIKMMVGLLRPTSGQISINGKDVQDVDRRTIGICPQDLIFWENLTCRENLKLMGDMYRVPGDILKIRIDRLLEKLFLTDKADTIASKLSGGMKRRLNLALAVMHEPEIVVLDEPSEGLDPQSRRVLWNYIRSLRDEKGKTVILTTHFMDEADRLSDRVAIIDHGKLLRLGTPEKLKKEIGEGDIIEMRLSNPEKNENIIKSLKKLENIISVVELDGRINIRALDVINRLPQVMKNVEMAGTRIEDFVLRQNSLEDVFIKLTGSKLRE